MNHWEDLTTNQSYTNRDITEVRAQLVDYVREVSEGKLTDLNESSVIMVLIELMSGMSDIMGYRMDRQALETYLPTAKQRKNVKAILSLVGYKLHMKKPAMGSILITLPDTGFYNPTGGRDKYVKIPKYTQLQAIEPHRRVPYCTAEDVYVPIDPNSTTECSVLQGTSVVNKYRVSDISESVKFYLESSDVASGTVSITIDGVKWEEVEDVTLVPESESRTFSVDEDKYDKAYILMHRNFRSLLPEQTDALVTIEYITTMGAGGEVPAGTIRSLVTSNDRRTTEFSSMIVHNPSATSGGSDRESTEHAKKSAPKYLTTVDRAITLHDYNNLLNALPGVVKGVAIDWKVEDSRYVLLPYVVDLYIVPTGDNPILSNEQGAEIEAYFRKRSMSTIVVRANSANYVEIDVEAEVFVHAGVGEFDDLQRIITTKLEEFYAPEKQEFRSGIRSSNIITAIETSDPRVSSVDLKNPTGNMSLDLTQFPILKSVNITLTTA